MVDGPEPENTNLLLLIYILIVLQAYDTPLLWGLRPRKPYIVLSSIVCKLFFSSVASVALFCRIFLDQCNMAAYGVEA